MTRERTRASSRIRLPTPCEGTSTYSIVERIFVGTKLTMTAPSQKGSVLRNPPTGNVLGAWPSLFIFVEGGASRLEKKPCPCEGDTIGLETKTTTKDLSKKWFEFVEVLAPPRGVEPLAAPCKSALTNGLLQWDL